MSGRSIVSSYDKAFDFSRGLFTLPASALTNKLSPAQREEALKSYFNSPLFFIENTGQLDPKVIYYAQSLGKATYFTEEGVYFSVPAKDKAKTVKLSFANSKKPSIKAKEPLPSKVNFFVGNDPSKWKTDLSTYGKVVYQGIYKGVEAKFYGTPNRLEYDLILSPKADPSKIQLVYEGADELRINKQGDLEVVVEGEVLLVQKKPYAYQEIGGKRHKVKANYLLLAHADKNAVGFALGEYDKNKELVIDPLLYSTFLGGGFWDAAEALAVDSSGHIYVAGETISSDFPTTSSAYRRSYAGRYDVFVTKLNPQAVGSASLVYSTFLGGSSWDAAEALAVDSSGHIYVAGWTESSDFPTTSGAYDRTYKWRDAFVAKLSLSNWQSLQSLWQCLLCRLCAGFTCDTYCDFRF